jgi:hypothetical protein
MNTFFCLWNHRTTSSTPWKGRCDSGKAVAVIRRSSKLARIALLSELGVEYDRIQTRYANYSSSPKLDKDGTVNSVRIGAWYFF